VRLAAVSPLLRALLDKAPALRRAAWSVALASILGVADAADYPSRAVQIIVPFAAGGSGDLRARQIAEGLGARLGRPVLVLNKPGASGSLGMRAVARAAPDGHTLGFINSAIAGIAPNLMREPGYDPAADFAPITRVALAQAVLVVRPDFPGRSLKELLDLARARPGTVTYASGGIGSINHLPVEMLARMAGVELLHVPYKGESEFMLDLLAGRVDMTITSFAATLPHIRAGRLRALAIGSTRRSAALPGVPTIAEAGVPGYEWHNWFGFVAPRGTPAGVIARLNREIASVVAQPALQRDYLDQGYEVIAGTPAEMAQAIAADLERFRVLIRAIGLQPQ
jgi:tripartite-type tricarboxylate transporter receptor subunit TctC